MNMHLQSLDGGIRGFTLIEMVVCLIIVSILSIALISIIYQPMIVFFKQQQLNIAMRELDRSLDYLHSSLSRAYPASIDLQHQSDASVIQYNTVFTEGVIATQAQDKLYTLEKFSTDIIAAQQQAPIYIVFPDLQVSLYPARIQNIDNFGQIIVNMQGLEVVHHKFLILSARKKIYCKTFVNQQKSLGVEINSENRIILNALQTCAFNQASHLKNVFKIDLGLKVTSFSNKEIKPINSAVTQARLIEVRGE